MLDITTCTLAIVSLPLMAAIIAGFFGKKLKNKLVHVITISFMALSFCLSVFLLFLLEGAREPFNQVIYHWAHSGGIDFGIGFLIDRLTLLMMIVVTFVSFMVHIYSVGYMKEDPGNQRFFCYISLFTFGMLILVMSNNFLQLFFGWEMVGLMSYLLIGFWYTKETAIYASLKAFLVNRLGDFGFILGIAAVFLYFGTLDYADVFAQTAKIAAMDSEISFAGIGVSIITFICLCLFIGAMGKSAQIPLHVWLPDSMEGPTPISALIHAATMVTAGVFMVARMSPLFEYSDTALNVVLSIGALTCLLMGLVGIVQKDIKRIIAYSTLSQLGYMMTSLGVSAYDIGIFHLMTHAFFKALLFLGAGSVILAMHHEQNIWKMGNLKQYMPVTYITMLLASLSLIGFPFFSGFYSKDLIIEAVHLSQLTIAKWAYPVVLGSVFITALYTFRLFFVVFHGDEHINSEIKSHLHESPKTILIPLILLAIPSVIAGYFFVGPLFRGFFEQSLMIFPEHDVFSLLKAEFRNAFLMGLHGFISLPFYFGVLGIFVAYLCYVKKPELAANLKHRFHFLYRVLKNKFGFDSFYENRVVPSVRRFADVCWRFGDQKLIDGLAVNGSAQMVGRLSVMMKHLQTGYLYHYAFTMIVGFLGLMAWLMLTE